MATQSKQYKKDITTQHGWDRLRKPHNNAIAGLDHAFILGSAIDSSNAYIDFILADHIILGCYHQIDEATYGMASQIIGYLALVLGSSRTTVPVLDELDFDGDACIFMEEVHSFATTTPGTLLHIEIHSQIITEVHAYKNM